jgi:hypothetical protein
MIMIVLYYELKLFKLLKKFEINEKNEKLNALKRCVSYKTWPKHTLEELMKIFEWRHFEPNTSID